MRFFKQALLINIVALNIVSYAGQVTSNFDIDTVGEYSVTYISNDETNIGTTAIMSPSGVAYNLGSLTETYREAGPEVIEGEELEEGEAGESQSFILYSLPINEVGRWTVAYDDSNDTYVDIGLSSEVINELTEAETSDGVSLNATIGGEDESFNAKVSVDVINAAVNNTFNYTVNFNDKVLFEKNNCSGSDESVVSLADLANGTYNVTVVITSGDKNEVINVGEVRHFDPSKEVEETEPEYILSEEDLAAFNEFPSSYDNVESNISLDETNENGEGNKSELGDSNGGSILGTEEAVEVNDETGSLSPNTIREIGMGIGVVALILICIIVWNRKKAKDKEKAKAREKELLNKKLEWNKLQGEDRIKAFNKDLGNNEIKEETKENSVETLENIEEVEEINGESLNEIPENMELDNEPIENIEKPIEEVEEPEKEVEEPEKEIENVDELEKDIEKFKKKLKETEFKDNETSDKEESNKDIFKFDKLEDVELDDESFNL